MVVGVRNNSGQLQPRQIKTEIKSSPLMADLDGVVLSRRLMTSMATNWKANLQISIGHIQVLMALLLNFKETPKKTTMRHQYLQLKEPLSIQVRCEHSLRLLPSMISQNLQAPNQYLPMGEKMLPTSSKKSICFKASLILMAIIYRSKNSIHHQSLADHSKPTTTAAGHTPLMPTTTAPSSSNTPSAMDAVETSKPAIALS